MSSNFNEAGFDQVDLMAPIQFDIAVRYLKEDPWEQVWQAHERAPNTRLSGFSVSRSALDLIESLTKSTHLTRTDPYRLSALRTPGVGLFLEGNTDVQNTC